MVRIKNEYAKISNLEAWDIVVSYVNMNNSFTSTTGIKYKAYASDGFINYIGGRPESKRATVGESISKQLFITAFSEVRKLDCINTKSIKPYINRQQSPFVGLLKSAGIIE